MSERPTLLSRGGGSPLVQPTQSGAVQGAFGDYRGLIAAGHGLSDAAGVLQQSVMADKDKLKKLNEELERRKINDYKVEVANAVALAVTGLNVEYAQRQAAGELGDDPLAEYEEKRTKAYNNVRQELAGIASDPVFKKHISDPEIQGMWESQTNSLMIQAASDTGQAREKRRIVSLNTMASTAFAGVIPGDFGALKQSLSELLLKVKNSNVGDDVKLSVTNNIISSAYEQATRSVTMRIPVPKDIIEESGFTPAQKGSLEALNSRLAPKKIPEAEIRKVFDDTVRNVEDSKSQEAMEAARAPMLALAAELASEATTPEAKQWPFARVAMADRWTYLVQGDMENLSATTESQKPHYDRLKELVTILKDPTQAAAWYDRQFIVGAHSDDRSEFMVKTLSAAKNQLELFDTGRSNEAIEGADLSPISRAVTAQFLSNQRVSEDRVKQYQTVAIAKFDRLGVPEEIRNVVPPGIQSAIIEALWNGENEKVAEWAPKLGKSFGSESLKSLSRSMLMPAGIPSNFLSMESSKPRASEYAAYFYLHAGDAERVELGAKSLEMSDVSKQWLVNLSDHAKNSSTWPSVRNRASEIAFWKTSFIDEASEREILKGSQFNEVTSDIQSLPGIVRGLWWQSGQNNDLSAGFQQMAMKIAQSRAYGQGTTQGDNQISQEAAVSKAMKDINNILARVYTAVDAGGRDSARQIITLVPTRMVKEGTLDLPISFGAQDAAVLGEHYRDGLAYIGYYEPRRLWEFDKSFSVLGLDISLGSTWNFLREVPREFPLTSFMFKTGSADILDTPPHLSIDFSKFHNIAPSHFGSDGEKLFRDWVNKPKVHATMASMALAQNGAWRYNSKTRNFEAMMFPGRSSSSASSTVMEPGQAQPQMYNFGTDQKKVLRPVKVAADSLLMFVDAYRLRRWEVPRDRVKTFGESYSPESGRFYPYLP